MVNNFFLGGEVLEILISYHSKVPIYEQIFKQQHLINSVGGKGTIVSKLSSEFIEDSIRKQLEKKIDEVIKFGIEVGIDSKEIKEIILLKLDDNGER